MNVPIPELYSRYFVQKDDERIALFQKIREVYSSKRGLYPGSFVHITPSFFIEEMVYVDSDRRMTKFFQDSKVIEYIEIRKHYASPVSVSSFQRDFTKTLPIDENSFDVLISLYSGFISQHCKKYLKKNGILIANNSHGDASIAFTDKDYELVSIVKRNGNNFRFISEKLEAYFVKKDGTPIDTLKVQKRMVGEAFTKTGYAYVFIKIV